MLKQDDEEAECVGIEEDAAAAIALAFAVAVDVKPREASEETGYETLEGQGRVEGELQRAGARRRRRRSRVVNDDDVDDRFDSLHAEPRSLRWNIQRRRRREVQTCCCLEEGKGDLDEEQKVTSLQCEGMRSGVIEATKSRLHDLRQRPAAAPQHSLIEESRYSDALGVTVALFSGSTSPSFKHHRGLAK